MKKVIKNIIRRFKFEELQDAVIPVFPETSWHYIKCQLIMHHQNFTTSNVATIIEEVINDSNLEVKELRRRLMRLELIDTCKHKRKVWYAYSISGSTHGCNHFGPTEFTQKLKKNLKALNKNKIEVDTIIFNGVMYISIKYVPSNNLNTASNYFALCLGQKYIFSTKKTASQIFIDAITNIMQYTRPKSLDLKGKDLMSLIHLLRTKTQGVLNPANIVNDVIYRDAEPIIKNTGIDYMQNKQRKNYAEKCFGKNPPVFDTLAVKGPSCSISDREIALKLPKDIRSGWEFRSHNIATFLTALAEKGVLVTPFPSYLSNLMTMGRNILTLEKK